MTQEAVKQVKPNVVLVSGRLTDMRRTDDGAFYSEITIPAVDEFSHPGVVEVRSKKRLGTKGDDVQLPCMVGGYRGKAFTYTDRDTGERFTRRPVNNVLDVIE